ncbi:MAG: hypothetical protein PHD74_06930, partial [Candidatus Krumholzibacteria bacterium]|nr:hypothetical protein [Candidatus Krumholzibacteria bacterium]
ARALSLLFSLGTLVLSAFAARGGTAPDGERPAEERAPWRETVATFLPPMLIAASPPFSVWSMSGSEIPLFTFLLLAGCMLLRKGQRPGSAFIVFGLLGLVRPEGTLYFAIALAYSILRGPRRAAVALAGAGIAVVFYAPYLLWKWRYFHAILPNTFYAKTGPLGLMLSNGARYLMGFFSSCGYLVVVGILLRGAAGRQRERDIPALLLAAVCALVVLVLGGDWMPHYRLLLPALPLVMVFVSREVAALAARDVRARLLAAALVLLAMAPAAVNYDAFKTEQVTVRAFALLGQRLQDILPEGTSIGCGSTGAIGYYTDTRIVDILGLTEPQIARHGQVVSRQPGHLKADGAYVFERKPDLLLLGNVQIHRGEWDRARMPIKVQEQPIIEQSEFDGYYDFVNIPIGGGFYLSCFKLKSYFLPVEPSSARDDAPGVTR